MNRKIPAIIVICCILLSACAASQDREAEAAPTVLHRVLTQEKLRVVTCADFVPVVYTQEDGSFAGADVRLCEYFAERLEVELEITHANLADFSAILARGEADMALGGIGPTETRKLTMLLSEAYYSRDEADHVLVAQSDRAQDLKTPEDFRGLIVGAQKGSLQYDLVCDQLPGARIVWFSGLEEGRDMLRSHDIDVLATSGIVAQDMDPDLFAAAPFTLIDETQSYIIAVSAGEEAWLDEINRMIRSVYEQDLYAQWLEEAWEEIES